MSEKSSTKGDFRGKNKKDTSDNGTYYDAFFTSYLLPNCLPGVTHKWILFATDFMYTVILRASYDFIIKTRF